MSCCPSETNSEKERQLTTILYKGDSVSIDQKEAALALKPSKSGIVNSSSSLKVTLPLLIDPSIGLWSVL